MKFIGDVLWIQCAGIMQLLSQERVCKPDQVSVPEGHRWFAIGTVGIRIRVNLSKCKIHINHSCTLLSSCPDIAFLAKFDYQQGRAIAADRVIPVYLRDKVTQ